MIWPRLQLAMCGALGADWLTVLAMSRFARTLTDSPARTLDQLCDAVVASTGPHAGDDIALLLARTADVMSRDTDRD